METFIGTRLRERRRQIGLTQAEMARQMGVSASYLNLIERNKRRIAGALLRNAAEILGLSLDDLDGATERRLMETLHTAADQPALKASQVETESLGELVGRYPGWARGIAALARSEQTAQETVRVLSDQLTHDPFLREAVHSMLTRISAVRSASEILTDFSDMAREDRLQFDRIVRDEARVLTEVGETLASYFEKSLGADRVLTPADEVDALFVAAGNRFPDLDAAAEALLSRVEGGGPARRWASAKAVSGALLQPLIHELISACPQIETDAGRGRAERALTIYAAAAILLPQSRFTARAIALGFDVEQLSQTFEVPTDAICHRLTALDPAQAPRMGYAQANASGSILTHLPVDGLMLPRYGIGCPIWLLFRAQAEPGVFHHQGVEFPSGSSFVFAAQARPVGTTRFGLRRHYVTDMLVIPREAADQTVYRLAPDAPIDEVGPGCRLCPRKTCTHRVEDPLLG